MTHVESHCQWVLSSLSKRLWVRAALFAVFGVIGALLALLAETYLPFELGFSVGGDAVASILNILASSMLAVTTFSLSVMVSAYGSAGANITPRATQLLLTDTTSHNVLATFIGAFLFSLVGIVALSTGFYGEVGRQALFIVTLLVIVIVVVSILSWIDHLSFFGRLGDTTDRLESITLKALEARLDLPYLGGHAWLDPDPPMGAIPIYTGQIGYVQFLDVKHLSAVATKHEIDIYVVASPGVFTHPGSPMVWVSSPIDDDIRDNIEKSFTIKHARAFEQDPRFGFIVLAEIASRGLSPATNDTGTPIDIIGRGVRLFYAWVKGRSTQSPEVEFPLLYIRPMEPNDFFDDFFSPIARDSATINEVQVRLHKALLAISQFGDEEFKTLALHYREKILRIAKERGANDEQLYRLREIESTK